MADQGFFASGRRPRGAAWKKGDRVLAPWEPTFLYSGTIGQIAGARALVEFDDGDAGWVDLGHLRPLALQPGQRVMSRRRMGPHFFPGAVQEVEGENVHVEFDDGKEERTTVAALRIPCSPMGRGAEQIKVTSHTAFLERLREGDRVWALWNGSALFAGTVHARRGGEAEIYFDDGDQAWIPLEQMLPLELIVGMLVMARRRSDETFAPGAISDTEGDRVCVRYQDGTEEWTTAAALALPVQPPSPGPPPLPPEAMAQPEAPPARVGWEPRVVLLAGGAIVAAVAGLAYLLGQR